MHKLTIKALNRLNLLKHLNISGQITIKDQPVKIPIRKSLGFTNMQLSEPWMTELLAKLRAIFPGTFVDVGVNLGQTLIKAKSVFKNCIYIGFEPNPYCLAYTTELIEKNKWENCKIIPIGISEKTELVELNFFYSESTDASASIIENFRPDQEIDHKIYIPVFQENFLQKILPLSENCFLKIDVEGAELEVISGLRSWIQKNQPIILMEILPIYSQENQFRLNRQQKLELIFHELNYVISRIDKEKMQLQELSEIGIHQNIDWSDYVIYPSTQRTRILNLFK